MPSRITVTDVLAWWGGLTGTLAFVWDVYKWRRRGPRVLVDVVTDMFAVGSGALATPDERLVVLTATNVGDQPTTITQMAALWYRARFQKVRHRPEEQFIISPLANIGEIIPHLLKPGERWIGAITQSKVEQYLNAGRFECGVFFTGSRKGRFCRVCRWPTPNKALTVGRRRPPTA
jgi:hypothetical protein